MLTHKVNTGFFLAVLIFLAAFSFYQPLPWRVFVIPVLLWFIIAVIGSGLVQSGYHIKTYNGIKTTDKKVAITFDDGPTPSTENVLELLKEYNVKATFFCIGKQIEKYPDILQKIIDEGHTVGNHTYSHSPKMGFFPLNDVLNEIESTDSLIQQHTLKSLLFRPPYGVTNPRLARALKVTGHYVIGWNIRSLDAVIEDENKIFNRITTRLAPGSIILLHDTSQKTVNVLEQLLILLQQQNYEAVTANQLLNIPAYEE
jgi:peptidoglycan/xylan/chitin deacetylase (PgdA/CDA1 family)